MKKIIVFFSIALVLWSCNDDEGLSRRPAQQDIHEIDSRMEELMERFNYPGLSLAIAKNGKLVYAKGYGVANKENNTPVTTSSEFRYSSFAKTITGFVAMQLIEAGDISLDTKVFGDDGILGNEFGEKAYSNRIKSITVRDLLQHTPGGWRNFVDDPVFDSPANLSRDEMIDWGLDQVPLATNPGTTYHYSNFGYVLLGRIVERVTGMAYADFVKASILDPIGAKNTYLARNGANEKGPREVTYYSQNNLSPYTSYNIARADATAGWVSTPSDVVRMLATFDGQPGKLILLGNEANQERRTPRQSNSGNYAKGVYRLAHPTLGTVYWHDGSWPGTQTLSISVPGEIAISVAMNSGFVTNYNQSLNAIAGALFAIAADESIEFQDFDQF